MPPTAHSAGSLRGLAAWSRCKGYAGPLLKLSPARQESLWVSLRCASVSIGIDPAAAQDRTFIVGIFATSALNGESDCTNAR